MYDLQAIKKYGQVGSQVFISWGDHLQSFEDEDLRRGLMCSLESQSEYAPGLKTFIGYCRNQYTGLTHNTLAYKVIPKSHRIEKKADKEKGLKEIAKLREML
jgi:hypothetical protein